MAIFARSRICFWSSSFADCCRRLSGHPLPQLDEQIPVDAPSAVVPKDIRALNKQAPALLDNHKRFHDYLRISLTEKCNLRCELLFHFQFLPIFFDWGGFLTHNQLILLKVFMIKAANFSE